MVLAAGGYPGDYAKGDVINGLDAAAQIEGKVFHAGTSLKDGQVVTNGGRVLCATAMGSTVADARRLTAWPRSQLERQLLPHRHRLPGHCP